MNEGLKVDQPDNQNITEIPESPESVDFSEEIRRKIEDKFDFQIPSEATQIDKKTLELLSALQQEPGEEGMWFLDDGQGNKKKYMVIPSTVNLGNSSLFNPPIREVLYGDTLQDVTSTFR